MKVFLDFLVLAIIYFLVFFDKWRRRGKDVLLVNTLLYVYLSFVIYFTLMPIIASLPNMLHSLAFNHYWHTFNLVPFIDVTMGRGDYVRQIILNIIMTIPFGFLLPLANMRKMTFVKVIIYTFLLSLSIEILQLIMVTSGRMADITDIITNVLGGIIGYTIYSISKPLIVRALATVR